MCSCACACVCDCVRVVCASVFACVVCLCVCVCVLSSWHSSTNKFYPNYSCADERSNAPTTCTLKLAESEGVGG